MIISKDLETEEGDLIFLNGDLSIFESDDEHISALFDSNKGEWKQFPTLGIDLIKYLNSPSQLSRLEVYQESNLQLTQDGYKSQNLSVDYNILSGKLEIKTNATRFR
jgi:hypothetical protein